MLRRADNLTLRLGSGETVEALVGATAVPCGPRGLAILDVFARPKPMETALRELEQQMRGAQDWIEVTNAVHALHQNGVLVDDSVSQPAPLARTESFDSAGVHVRMLDDRARTSALIEGIQEIVRPGDVVVEIGTGTGVLATAAALAGARHVYAIEVGQIGQYARAVFAANGVEDIVTVVEGWSTRVELPERGNVLISEILGDDVLSEHVIELTLDARRRLLEPDARHLTTRITMHAVPVAIPLGQLDRQVFSEKNTSRWQAWYGIDFSPLVQSERDTLGVHPDVAEAWPALSDPVVVADLDLATVESFDVISTATGRATSSGLANGVFVYFEARVGTNGLLSNRAGVDAHPSWQIPVWRLGSPVKLTAGQPFQVTYTRGGLGKHDLVELSAGPTAG